MKRLKVSIIIPSYNAEKYVRECIDSVLEQRDFEDYEVIVVDDCSTDNTLSILKSYNNPKLKIIEQEKNAGPSVARNVGMDKSQGEYLLFVDADDILEPTTLSRLWKHVECHPGIDFVYGRTCTFPDVDYYKKSYDFDKKKNILTFDDDLNNVRKAHIDLPNSPWNKLIRRSFLTDNKIEFVAGIQLEDYDMHLQAYDSVASYAVERGVPTYHYRIIPTSRNNVLTKLRQKDAIFHILKMRIPQFSKIDRPLLRLFAEQLICLRRSGCYTSKDAELNKLLDQIKQHPQSGFYQKLICAVIKYYPAFLPVSPLLKIL